MKKARILYCAGLLAQCGIFAVFGAKRKKCGLIEIEPAWSVRGLKKSAKANVHTVSIYNKYFQKQVLGVLHEYDIDALPSLYTSAFQLGYAVYGVHEIEDLLPLEVNRPHHSLVLVPVIHDALFTDLTNKKRYTIYFDLAVYRLEKERLGIELLRDTIQLSGTYADINDSNRFHRSIVENIGAALKRADWSKTIAMCTDFQNSRRACLPYSKYRFPKGQTMHFFGQSSYMFYNRKPIKPDYVSFWVEKSNVLILKANEATDKLVFEFNIAEEFPEVLYAYLVLPNLKVVQIQPADIHIQQPPGALPNSMFTGKRYLVVNMPGLTNNAIACYAVKHMSREAYDTAYYHRVQAMPFAEKYSKDYFLHHSCDTVPWQIRMWTPLSSWTNKYGIPAEGGNVSINTRKVVNIGKETKHAFSHLIMFLLQGKNTPLPFFVSEPLSYLEPVVIRTSETNLWDSLYCNMRDLIYAVIDGNKAPKLLSIASPSRQDSIQAIFRLHKYISDSLRYMHVSFVSHKIVPEFPESTLSKRTGDCKDFSILLITQLKLIGIHAVPALVHTNWLQALSMDLPSHGAANHMVVYIPEYEYWIDPSGGALPPWITPQHLTNLNALVLFRDSTAIVNIEPSDDSAYYSRMQYTLAVDGKDVACISVEDAEYGKSAYVRSIISQIDSSRLNDILFPPQSVTKKYSYKKHSMRIAHIDEYNRRLKIERRFIATNASSLIGGRRVVTVPEMPLAAYVNLFSLNSRKNKLYLPASLICDIVISIDDNRHVQWPKGFSKMSSGDMITVQREHPNELRIKCRIEKGIMGLKRYARLKRAFELFRDFFSTPLVLEETR